MCGDLAEGMVVLCLGGVINMLAIMFSVLTYDIVRGKGRKYVRVDCVVRGKHVCVCVSFFPSISSAICVCCARP